MERIYETNTSICKITNDRVIKEFITSDTKKIQREIEILQELKEEDGFPKILNRREENGRTIIEMNYLGEELQFPDNVIETRRIILEIVKLINKLHGRRIIHNDMKPNNVLMNENGEISIIDFSHSKKHEIEFFETTLCYGAPELSKGYEADIWSIGCIYYELLTDKILFDVENEKEFNKMIAKKEHIKLIKMMKFNKFDEELLLSMLKIGPTKRISTDEILNFYLQKN
jgi:serine/threonine protein kinase